MGENKSLLLKGAMTYGFILGIYWVIKYLFFIFGVSIPTLALVYWGLTLAVPLIAYQLTKRYRNDIGGQISFFHAWRFGMMLYFFAALIVSIEHFIFFQFIAGPNFLVSSVNQVMEILKESQMSTEVVDSVRQLNLSPIHMAIQGVFNNIFYGIILSIPVAALLCRNNATGSVMQEESLEEKQ